LADPVSKSIPEFRNPRVMMEAARGITIVDLLTHTPGLASGGAANAEALAVMKKRKPADTLGDFIPRLGAVPLDFQPGTRWRYSGGAGVYAQVY
jgi:CubicO group peptidase (beta-lactamase class C family)